jgi:gliding motility-associated-like protein
MKILNLFMIAVLVAFSGNLAAQQTVNMTDGGTVTIDCGAGAAYQHPFSHDGSAAYVASVNDTITVCPDAINGSKVTVRLTSDQDIWTMHESDSLYIYDGTDTGAELVGVFNAATDTNGIVVTATIDNPSGCLTFVFISDGADEAEFSGLLFCGYPCQPFTPYIASNPPADPGFPDTGYIDICQGDTVWMWAQAEFPYSSINGGIGYDQALDNSSFYWELADGTTFTNEDTIMVAPALGAGYDVQLVITDTLGCPQAGFNKIRVGTTPSFAEVIELFDDTICTTESTFLLGGINSGFGDTVGVQPNPGSFINGGVFTGLTYLPDGNGVEYETSIPIAGFDSLQTIESAADILEVCLTIEHSYLGDLEMSLTCPNGTEIVMFNSWTGEGISPSFTGGFGGGGTYLGDAMDQGLGTPGIGWEYCFGESAIWGTLGEEFGLGNTTPTTLVPGNAMSSGTYQPEETYDSFIGCPINGDWTITVRDNIGIDDGYIFEWGILFNPEVNPNVETYQMEVDSTWWSPSPSITQFFGDTMIEVSPGVAGDYFYTFNIEDNFGCQHDTTIVVTVDPPLQGTFGSENICSLTYDLFAADTLIVGSWEWEPVTALGTPSVTWSPDSLTGNPSIEVSTPGSYNFMYESSCGQRDTLSVVFNTAPEEVSFNDTVLCEGDQISFDGLSSHLTVDYDWSITSLSVQEIAIDSVYEDLLIQLTVSNDCGIETESMNLNINRISASGPDLGCNLTTELLATNDYADGVWSFNPPSSSGTADFSLNVADLEPLVDVDEYGVYGFYYTDDLCGTVDSVEVNFVENPEIAEFVDTPSICIKDFLEFDAGEFPGVSSWFWEYDPADSLSTYDSFTDTSRLILAEHAGIYIVTATGPCGEVEQQVDFGEYDCGVEVPNVFTPNGDEFNQNFMISNLEFHPGNEVLIYDRWGRKVYEASPYLGNEWDGANRNSGVFFYVLALPQIGEVKTGYVHLISSAE